MKNSSVVFKCLIVFLLGFIAACGVKQDQAAENQGVAAPDQVKAAQEERTIKHKMGETKVPADPKNIGALQPFIMDHLLALGVKPGSGVMFDQKWPAFLADDLKETKVIGNDANPNLEAILAAGPDLIIGQPFQEKAYDGLSKIAPTIILDTNAKDWRSTFLEVGEITGKTKEARSVLEAFDKKASEARKTLQESIGNETVMFLRVTDKELRYYGIKNYKILYQDLGLQPPKEFVTDESKTFQAISMEKLPEINPDHILLLVQSEEKLNELKGSSLWQNMTAVKKNQVHSVDYDLWLQGWGPIAYSKLIDETLQFLARK
ncbi:ABC transporter substrate-binding protein [Paenibacillus naphthalenovorans]|uniref:Iron siderophore-binding protein n=1 Tax=Paenibacillus naphthalenovorans TaxID=162209 RepID=A0A0U2N245_9BACL|nr:ABC transporter substrate-binding protein [Paenibacillus naphthalenovorans]ALS25151.1 iron siderophore-binding protein [Paenibacillus naphthalenovorans]